jgi:hypothetical protein
MMDLRKVSVLSTDASGKVTRARASELDLSGVQEAVSEAQYVVFKELFLDVRDRFISGNDYGIDSYLSVRIRHGTLQGQIRNTFESLNLVSQIDTIAGQYARNAFWEAKAAHLGQHERDGMQAILAKFSSDVDELARNLKDKFLQVRTESRKSEGLFDYTLDEQALVALFLERFSGIRDYDAILDEMFSFLWKRTEANLAKIRVHIESELKSKVYGRLVELQEELKGVVSYDDLPDLFTNVVRCMTAIQNDFDKLSSWFHVARPGQLSQFTAEELVAVCVASTNDIHSQARLAPVVAADPGLRFKGTLLPHFSDILRTLLENIIKHADVPPREFDVRIRVGLEAAKLVIEVENKISARVRALDPAGRLEEQRQKMASADRSAALSTEGGTGYSKVVKIVAVDLERRGWKLSFDYPRDMVFRMTLTMESEGLFL